MVPVKKDSLFLESLYRLFDDWLGVPIQATGAPIQKCMPIVRRMKKKHGVAIDRRLI